MSLSSSHREMADRCRTSLDHARTRREVAGRARRRRIRLRGGGLSVASVALLIGIVGAGAAVGQNAGAGGAAKNEAAMLSKGSQGNGVSEVQRALGIPGTGAFDERTEQNVRVFQRRNGLMVDGIVGPQTRAALGLGGSSSTGSEGQQQQSAQQAPAQDAAPQQQQGGSGSASLERIAQCESGGDPQAVGGGGQFRGKYQFTYETWRSVGGSGDPADASEAEQDQRAATLMQRSGPSQWPVCGQ
jgi:hypothetical protein